MERAESTSVGMRPPHLGTAEEDDLTGRGMSANRQDGRMAPARAP